MHSLDRDPLLEETADELGIELEECWKWNAETGSSGSGSLDQLPISTGEASLSNESFFPTLETDDPDGHLEYYEEIQILKEELLKLDHRDRLAVSLYYFQGLKLHEIAAVMNLTENRVSQIRLNSLQQIRGRLQRLREEVA